MRRMGTQAVLCGLIVAGAALSATDASAHFRLEAPAVMTEMNDLGDPQKAYPCGDASMTLTGDSTTFSAGDTITIEINETIYHPGHYRVALAIDDLSELPPDPPVTPIPNVDDCAMTEIMNPPVYPVLADGMLPHDAPFDGQQSFEVTLPEDVECENCTLQVVQYMSSHAAPCFYYHCANIAITGAGGETTGDPGTSTGGETTGDPGTTSGAPETTGAPGETSAAGDDSGPDPDPDTGAGGEDDSGAATGPAGTDSDGSGQDDSSDGGGCRTGGGAPLGLFALVPLLLAARRRD